MIPYFDTMFVSFGIPGKSDELQIITSEIYKKSPRTFNSAYNKAKEDFEEGKVTFDHFEER